MSNNNKPQTCGVAVANSNNRSGWDICGNKSTSDLGETKQVKLADGTLQMGRFFCDEHKGGEVQ